MPPHLNELFKNVSDILFCVFGIWLTPYQTKHLDFLHRNY